MTKFLKYSLLLAALALPLATPSLAQEFKPDDTIGVELSAEGWVSTKTARVMVNVEAAVTSNTAGTMRAAMIKSLNDVVKADWRLTTFNRSQDSTGMERWSAMFEVRVPEADLNGLGEKAKAASKAGMQIRVSNIDFSPTLDETQATAAQLRTQVLKAANEQLASINATFTGRNYRISSVEFMGGGAASPPAPMMMKALRAMSASGVAGGPEMDMAVSEPSMERSEKMIVSARVVFAAVAPTASIVPVKP